MFEAADRIERQRERLAELEDLGMTLARNLHARALAAEDDALAADLALAFQRTARSVRQTMALGAKLERDRKLALREDAQDQAREIRDRVYRKRIQVRRALAHEIWNEYEDEDEAEALIDAMAALAMEQSDEDDFLDAPIETCLDRLRANLGLAANTPEDAPPDSVLHQSSG